MGPPYPSSYQLVPHRHLIAALGIDPTVIAQMGAGQQLKLELTDLNSASVTINLPLDQLASVHKEPPAQTFDFKLDEE